MTCETVDLPSGQKAIVCFGRTRRKRCACGNTSTRLCDWKVPGKRSGTCDKPLCANCAFQPAPEKDLCPTHVAAYSDWKAKRSQVGA